MQLLWDNGDKLKTVTKNSEPVVALGEGESVYDEAIFATDEKTGKAMIDYPCFIETIDGKTQFGRTDSGKNTKVFFRL